MYIQWDSEAGTALGLPNNTPKGDDWFPCVQPGARQSRAQELVWTLVDGVVYGEWSGSDDPLDEPAHPDKIKETWKEILQLPLIVNGHAFQFDRDSRELMQFAILGLQTSGGEINWRLDDNSTISVDAVALQNYYDELSAAVALRGLAVDNEYVAFKANGATVRQLIEWRESYQ